MPVVYRDHPGPRTTADIRDLAIAIQANLVQLKVADARRRKIDPSDHEIQVVSPGPVIRCREILISRTHIAAYNDTELQLRMHEVWGQFCLLQWVFEWQDGIENPPNFADMQPDADVHCGAVLEAKLAEVHAVLWRIRYQQGVRAESSGASAERDRETAERSAATAEIAKVAARIPVTLMGKEIAQNSDDELAVGACEHAGMLATLRWLINPSVAWGDESLGMVHENPFEGLAAK